MLQHVWAMRKGFLLGFLLLLPVLAMGGETDLDLGVGFGPWRHPPRSMFGSLELDRWVVRRNFGFLAAVEGNDTAYWAGVGLMAGISLGRSYELAVSSGPGYFPKLQGINLGSRLEFRSMVLVTRTLPNGWRAGIGASHVSNAGIAHHNPGAEAIRMQLGIPF